MHGVVGIPLAAPETCCNAAAPRELDGLAVFAAAHTPSRSRETFAVLDALPRFKGGKYLFSTTDGASPVWMGTKPKERLDRRMLRTLRALARKRGDDFRAV